MTAWFAKQRYDKNAALRLFFFPYAGGGSSIFKEWELSFSSEIDIFSIVTPGREARFLESPISSTTDLASALSDAIIPYLDTNYIFVGHSNGALTCFELAKQLVLKGHAAPAHLVLSARAAPHIKQNFPDPLTLSNKKFVHLLRKSSRIPIEILDDPEALEVFLPMLRADYSLGTSYSPNPQHKIDCDVSLFSGKRDPDISRQDMECWDQYFTRQPKMIEFNGDHFFIHSCQNKFLSELNKIANIAIKRLKPRKPLGLKHSD